MSRQTALILSKTTSRLLVLVLSAMAAALMVQAFVVTPSALALGTVPDDTWMTNGTVYATALSEDGSTLYIGGKFTSVRENPPGTDGRSRRVSNLAAIDVATGSALRWKPQVTGDGAVVHSLAVEDGKVFIGGNFTAVGGVPRKNLAAVDATDGSVDPFAPQVGGATSYVYALLADEDESNKLYIGGGFKKVDGQPRGHLAAFDLATGTLDSAWTPKTNNKVRDLEFAKRAPTERPSIFVAGAFSSITGSDGTEDARQSVARVYADTGDLHPWEIPSGTISGPQTGWDLTATPTILYGGFGAGPNYLAAFNLNTGNLGTQAWRFNTVGNVQTVALSADGSRLFFGGHFGIARLRQSVCGGTNNLRGLASVNPLNGRIYCDWLPSIEGRDPNYAGPWALTATDAHLWVGGGFTGISGEEQRNLARFTL